MAELDKVEAILGEVGALKQAAGILGWDQEVMMPPSGAEARADQLAAIEAAVHERMTGSALGEALESARPADEIAERNIELAKRARNRAINVPVRLAAEIVRATSRAQQSWVEARTARSFSDFAPVLSQIVELKREEADAIRNDGQSRYAALLQDFEPGMDATSLRDLLEGLRPHLTVLREELAEKDRDAHGLSGNFTSDDQLALARLVAEKLGYNFEAGRLDLSVHPFSSGTRGDSRITTRIASDNFLDCLYSTIHETGHALYEQGLQTGASTQPVGQHVSMGVHESQSRIWENQIGRSAAFAEWLFPLVTRHLGDLGLDNANQFYRAINQVKTGFIRTEADEVHYNLHILLRFELELDLFDGTLDVSDLEDAWNETFKRDFGIDVPDAKLGVLQDIHWGAGLFGYFPTYALGNLYAAQLFTAMQQNLGPLDDQIRAGHFGNILGWLRTNIHHPANLHNAEALMKNATGQNLTSNDLADYLRSKFLGTDLT